MDGRDNLEEIFNLQQTKVRFNLEEKCLNGEDRCQITDCDSDNYSFEDQCNLNKDHNGEHAFGLDSLLYGVLPPSTCDIDNDVHDGSCCVCLVREVRRR